MQLMDDPFVIAGGTNADLSTKEILKRYQDRMGQRPAINEIGEVHNRQDNSSRPPPTRVDTDPTLFTQASSVRPVQEPPVPQGHPNNGTPPHMWRGPSDLAAQPSPYRNNSEPQVERSENGQQREWRNSGWGRQNGGVGVGNAT